MRKGVLVPIVNTGNGFPETYEVNNVDCCSDVKYFKETVVCRIVDRE
jgi:hypothetical protein